MTITDLIILGLSAFLIWRGAARGFVRSILGPLCLVIATALSAYYYHTAKNLPVALVIGLFGPMALHFILSNYVKLWHQMTNPDWKPNTISRVAGASLSLIWGWAFIVMTLILLMIVPPFHQSVTSMRHDIDTSFSYALIKPFMAAPAPKASAYAPTGTTPKNVDLNAMAHDPRFQAVLNDPEVQKAIEENNFAKLMSNPKILELTQQMMQDPDMMKKLMALQQAQTQNIPPKQ